MAERWTVLKILQWTADYFSGKEIDSARLEAELLLAATLGLDRVGLYVNFERPLNNDELTAFRERVKRRAQREPVQYILGETEFWSLMFNVNPAVLVPRADTEVLVEESLARIEGSARVLDVGTGSGAIAIALAHEKPEIQVTALDCSEPALEVARDNARRNGVAERVTCLVGDLASLPPGPFAMVVSNPPYIPSGDWQKLMPEVRDHEPRLALDGGDDGLEAYRQLVMQAGQVLIPGGWLLVEVGINQATDVSALFKAAGLIEIGQRNDYSGVARVVMGRTKR
ncbi:MAG: peptide chain release factor N(5)-glutamine methyltransferase [Deltaproteobacteria bacterium]|nr:MAG: peptide chain release factor N(5)-glutamine methyltransferase [Deltaproteobacteria bacterium]